MTDAIWQLARDVWVTLLIMPLCVLPGLYAAATFLGSRPQPIRVFLYSVVFLYLCNFASLQLTSWIDIDASYTPDIAIGFVANSLGLAGALDLSSDIPFRKGLAAGAFGYTTGIALLFGLALAVPSAA